MDNPGPRTLLGPALVDRQSDPSEHTSTITTRKFDVNFYDLTGKIRYLDEEGTTVPTSSQIKNGKKMRDEIKTIEQFEKLGGYKEVAKRYQVSVGTAHSHMMSLRAKAKREAKEEQELIQGPSQAEVEQFFTDDKPQVLPEVEMNPSETYHLPSDSQNASPVEPEFNAVIDCPKRDVSIACETYYGDDKELEKHVSELEKQWDRPNEDDLTEAAIRMCWDNIGDYLTDIRRIEMERVDKRIKERLQGMMEGI